MKIIDERITLEDLKALAKERFGNMIKAVVDINTEVMAIGGSLHADEEQLLLENGSNNNDLWGINLYPEVNDRNWIEYDSMINIRSWQNNNGRGVDDPLIREKIVKIVEKLIAR